MEKFEFVSDGKSRIDVFLSEQTGFTRSRIKKMMEDGAVTANGVAVTKSGTVLPSSVIVEVFVDDPVEISVEPENIPLDIVYEDGDVAVINKPCGLVTHPCAGTPNGTLVNALMYHVKDLSGINGVFRPGIVHRLDKDTTGLIVIAKNDKAHLSLATQIEKKTAGRYYLALLEGNIKEDEGVIDEPIGRHKKDRKKMAVDKDGRRALTYYTVMQRFGGKYTLVKFKLGTGRTHQIRVHSKFIGHPVVGDPLYNGKEEFGLKTQLLHAFRLEFDHPSTGERMVFSAPLPELFQKTLKKLSGIYH